MSILISLIYRADTVFLDQFGQILLAQHKKQNQQLQSQPVVINTNLNLVLVADDKPRR
uniref:Uncharacterized protein n=1 Tax=Strigamia maritima TaxID=126957 RepID=T1JA33_STRMM